MNETLIILYSLAAGSMVGIVFSLLKLPIPAPQNFSGIAGIIGIYFGFKIGKIILGYFF